jgi:hypothetical protein
MKRFIALAVLLAAFPATARADILWDLVWAGNSGGDYGISRGLNALDQIGMVCGPSNNLTCGVITVATTTAVHVYGNDYTQIVGGGGAQNNGGAGALGAYSMGTIAEKGVGMCIPGGSAPNDCASASPPFKEIDGLAGTGPLFLDLNTTLNMGPLNHIWLSSVQINEGYEIYYSTTTIGGAYTLLCSGNQPTIGADVADCAVNTGLGIKFLRFNSVTFGDFSVQALRFNSIVPEPGTMGLLATGLVALTGAGFIRRRNKKS